MGFPVSRIDEFSRLIGVNVSGRPGGAVSLAVGMTSILTSIPGLKGLMSYWYNFALMFEALFILTTVDTGTRVARFLIQEFGGTIYKPLADRSWKPGIIISSLIVVIAWAYLIYSGNVSTIWPMFGVSNQLLGAIALGVGTTIIIKMGKLKYSWVTLIPMLFLFTMTFTASIELIKLFFTKAASLKGAESFTYTLDGVLVVLMLILAGIALIDMLYKWFKIIFIEKKPSDAV